MKPQIVRLDEAALRALGMDPVMVNAFRNIMRVTGVQSDGPTVPGLGDQAAQLTKLLGVLREQVLVLQAVIEFIQFQPEPVTPDLSGIDALAALPVAAPFQQIEHLTTEIRQIAEAVGNMREYLQTELRQVAEQQTVLAGQLQELKQGTTP